MFSNLDIGFLFSFAVMESNMVREYAEGCIVALSYVLFLSTIKTGFKNIKITKRIALSAGFFVVFFSVWVVCDFQFARHIQMDLHKTAIIVVIFLCVCCYALGVKLLYKPSFSTICTKLTMMLQFSFFL